MGYAKVYLTTDHGFVITGILDEADKVLVPSGVDLKVEERYVLSNDHLTNVDWIDKVTLRDMTINIMPRLISRL